MDSSRITIRNMSDNNPFNGLWVEKYRPTTLEDIVLSKEDREFFESLRTKQEIPHLLFAGTPGVGKTTTAKVIVTDILGSPDYMYLNASDENSIDVVRSKLTGFARTKSFDGKVKIVILDEMDGMSSDAMKCLRNVLEEYAGTCRFIFTCNYLFKVIPALQSRCNIINLTPPLEGVLEFVIKILKKEEITIPQEQKPLLLEHIRKNLPDLRRIINDIQKFSITGTLKIRNEVSTEFAEGIFKDIRNKKDLMAIRKYVIENEKEFSNDYRNLLKEIFEAIFVSDLSHDCKTSALLTVSDAMYENSFVVDKEIGAFAALIKLFKLLNDN